MAPLDAAQGSGGQAPPATTESSSHQTLNPQVKSWVPPQNGEEKIDNPNTCSAHKPTSVRHPPADRTNRNPGHERSKETCQKYPQGDKPCHEQYSRPHPNRNNHNRGFSEEDPEIVALRNHHNRLRWWVRDFEEYTDLQAKQIAELKEVLAKKEEHIAYLIKILEHRDSKIGELTGPKGLIAKKEEDIAELKETLQRRDSTIGELTGPKGIIAKKEEDIAELKETLQRRDSTIEELTGPKGIIAKKEEDIAELKETLQRRDSTIEELTGPKGIIAKKEERITQLTKILQHRDSTVTKQGLEITELNRAILRSTKIVSTTTRDDDHFSGEFARLAGAIRNWVNRDFRGVPGVKHQDLQPTIQESLKAVVFRYNPDSDKGITFKEIEAAFTEKIVQQIFRSDFVFRIHGLQYHIEKYLGGPTIQKRIWHSQTVNMVIQNKLFDNCFRKGVNAVAADLHNCFGGMVKPGNQELCRKTLQKIVEQAAKLEVEICRQISLFELQTVKPGSKYIPSQMEDRSGAVDDAGDEGRDIEGFIVQGALFPPVIRWELDSAGNRSGSQVVVRKGIVFTAAKTEEG